MGSYQRRLNCKWKEACIAILLTSNCHKAMRKSAKAKKGEAWRWKHFFWLCKKGHAKLAQQLLSSYGYLDVNRQEKETELTPLMAAAVKGYNDVVALLCASRGILVDLADKHGITALMFASREGQFEAVKILLASGADCNAKTNNGSTCLMIAAKEGHYQVVSYLLKHGAADLRNQNGSTALTFAAEKARSAAVEVLIKHRANVNVRTNKRGVTPLIFAVKARDLKTARLLLENGADVDAQTLRTKYSALIAAVLNRDRVKQHLNVKPQA